MRDASPATPAQAAEPAPAPSLAPAAESLEARSARLALELASAPATHFISPGAEQVVPVDLASGEARLVAIAGAHTTDLDAWLIAPSGLCVARDMDSTDCCVLVCAVEQDGRYELHVRNLGDSINRYALVSD